MYPTLLQIGEFSLPSYFTMIMVGYLLALLIFRRDAHRQGIDPDDSLDIALWVLVWGVIGARLLHVVADGFFMDYVHLCTDPMLVEGRDLIGRPLSELEATVSQSGRPLAEVARLCSESAQCLTAQESNYDVGAICNTDTGMCHPEQDCFRWAMFWAGGMAFYGGFLGAIGFALYFTTRWRVGMVWAPKMSELPRTGPMATVPVLGTLAHGLRYLRAFPQGYLKIADIAAPTVIFAHAVGRMGCFLAGCCFGRLTEGPLGVRFPAGSAAYQLHRTEHLDALRHQHDALGEWLSLPVHPTQLYEVGINLSIFAFLYFVVRRRKRFHGHVFGWLLVFYGVARFGLELFRADSRGEWFGLSTSQLIAVPLVLAGAWILARGLAQARDIIDDGADPPLGLPLTRTVYQPQVVAWDDLPVSPVDGWQASLEKALQKSGRALAEAGQNADGSGENKADADDDRSGADPEVEAAATAATPDAHSGDQDRAEGDDASPEGQGAEGPKAPGGE